MPRLLTLLLLALTVGVSSSHAQNSSSDADRLIGTWSGSYAGDGAGSYTATFKSIVVDSASVKMAYDEPGNSGIEVQLEAIVDGSSLTGTWKSVDTGAKTVVASGTFTGSKR
jgi:hypothetical protein